MSAFAWDEKYSVHVNEMDSQHKRLFEIMDKLHTAMGEGKGNVVMADVLHELHDYTVKHFSQEERYMEKCKYVGLADQKIQHAQFVKKISEYEKEIQEKKLGLSLNVMNFLKDWLVNHIQKTDAMYTKTFHDNNIR